MYFQSSVLTCEVQYIFLFNPQNCFLKKTNLMEYNVLLLSPPSSCALFSTSFFFFSSSLLGTWKTFLPDESFRVENFNPHFLYWLRKEAWRQRCLNLLHSGLHTSLLTLSWEYHFIFKLENTKSSATVQKNHLILKSHDQYSI